MFRERIVYHNTVERKCWNSSEGYYMATIATFVIEKSLWLWKKYEIRQIVPYISKPFYNREYETNNNLQSGDKHERQIAKLAITLLKNGQNIDDTRNNDNP